MGIKSKPLKKGVHTVTYKYLKTNIPKTGTVQKTITLLNGTKYGK